MKIFISRVSTEEQSELRQIQNVEGFDKVIIDKCDGDIGLWDRPETSKYKKYVDNGTIKHIEFHQVDRMGRNLSNILSEYEELTEKELELFVENHTFRTLMRKVRKISFLNYYYLF